jgi:signal peptidase I
MKKRWMVAAVTCALLFIGLIVARLTNMLQFYSIPVSSMSPTLEPGAHIFTSNLVKEKINDVVVFSRISDEFDGADIPGKKITCTYRLLAKQGDKLQLKNGLVYINGKYADDSTRLKFYYKFSAAKNDEIIKLLGKEAAGLNETDWYDESSDSIIAALSYAEYVKIKTITPINKLVAQFSGVDYSLYKNDDAKKWSANNYGPVTIPPNTCFLLGDNRNAARDSRYVGPVPVEDIKGVMIGRY